jgi:hypothetical protein
MFLPIDMKNGLSEAVVNRNGKMVPLLQNAEVLLDFDTPVTKGNFLTAPPFIFTFILTIILILSGLIKRQKIIRFIDISIYSVYSVLAVLMIFFNFFSDHQQMKWNLNIIWLNPFILFCLISLILNKPGTILFRIVFYISALFLVVQFLLPQEFNIAFSIMVIILLIRSSVRGEFDWNPLNLPQSPKLAL